MPSTKTQTNGKVKSHAARGKGGEKPAPGARLAAAFEAVDRFPVLVESQARVMKAATAETARVGEIIEAVESDVALTVAVLRAANRAGAPQGVATIPEAVEVVKSSGVLAIAGTASVFDFFEQNGNRDLRPERFRVHALATQRAADQVGRAVGWSDRDELAVAALLHDIGRLVIMNLHPGHRPYFDAVSNTPEQRIREERELARRWNVPQAIAVAIERHHAEDAEGLAAMVGIADMVAHYSQGEAVAPEQLRAAAQRCGLDPESLRQLLYEMPYLRHLSEGMVYKQIAGEMQLSVSTIRTHLHNVYGKIGAVDRAQAVLAARDRGWI